MLFLHEEIDIIPINFKSENHERGFILIDKKSNPLSSASLHFPYLKNTLTLLGDSHSLVKNVVYFP